MNNNRIQPPNGMPPLQRPQLSIKDTTAVECSCGNDVFVMGMMFRRISKILAGTDKDAISPIEVPICAKCQTPVQELLAPELRKPSFTLA